MVRLRFTGIPNAFLYIVHCQLYNVQPTYLKLDLRAVLSGLHQILFCSLTIFRWGHSIHMLAVKWILPPRFTPTLMRLMGWAQWKYAMSKLAKAQ